MTEQKIFVKNLEIYYKTIGEGCPLLILHGWGSRSDYWINTARLLAKNNIKVVIPDLPGFGKSNKPPMPWDLEEYSSFVEEFTKTVGLDKFHLLGHSFGGSLAIKFALKNSKINKLFLVGASCIRKKTIKKKILLIASKIFKVLGYIPVIRKAFYKFIVKSDYPSAKGLMKKTYLNIIKEDLTDKLEYIKNPTILIWGEKDSTTPLKQGEFINSKIKGSELIVIPGGMHDLERQMPDILAKNILEKL